MTRAEAIERLEWLRMVGNHVDSVTLGSEDMGYFDMAIAALKEQKECAKNAHWISVKERLPEVGQRVLMCDTRDSYVGVWSLERDEDGLCWLDASGWWQPFAEVTHWMPLPEPPKEE